MLLMQFPQWRITITELKDKEHKEPSVTEKVKGYFNIFEYASLALS